MKRYDSYKNSGVKWIGEIPSYWKVKRLGSHFIENRHINSELTVTEAYKFNYGTLIRKDIDVNLKEVEDIYRKYTLLNKNDIVINGLNLNYDFVSQRVAKVETKGIITSAYLVLTPRKEVYVNYFCYLFKAMDSQKLFHSMGSGIRLTLSFEDLKSQLLPIPPLSEQHAIVSFLDTELGKIDTYMDKEQQLIERLKELKQSLIARAVTHGIDPNVKMKPSGIDWIGEIPEHWKLLRAKNMFQRMNRPVRPEDETITCFRDGQVTLRKRRRLEGFTESFKEIGYQGIRKGDLVIHQMDAFAGSIGVSDSDGKGTPVYICLQPKGSENNFYYAYLLREMARTGYIKSLYRGIRERSSDFRFETLTKLFLPIPPASEQRAIVDYLHDKTSKIDKLITEKTRELEYMKELRQRIISDAVTGKIDVRS